MDDEIQRRDRAVFFQEFLSPVRVSVMLVIWIVLSGGFHGLMSTLFGLALVVSVNGVHAWFTSKKSRFHDPRFRDLWLSCEERHTRFEQVYARGKKVELAGIAEMPKTVENVKGSVYRALRKADLLTHEISLSEGGLSSLPKPLQYSNPDPQAQELLQAADRNVAEYRNSLGNIMAGVHRTEAQAAVFMTTIDTLRMRMLGHRMAGRSSGMDSQELLIAMSEAKMQLQSIDRALDELEQGLYPNRLTPPPPSAASTVRANLSQMQPGQEETEEKRQTLSE